MKKKNIELCYILQKMNHKSYGFALTVCGDYRHFTLLQNLKYVTCINGQVTFSCSKSVKVMYMEGGEWCIKC